MPSRRRGGGDLLWIPESLKRWYGSFQRAFLIATSGASVGFGANLGIYMTAMTTLRSAISSVTRDQDEIRIVIDEMK